MRIRCDLHGRLMTSLLVLHGELAEMHGKINAKSLYPDVCLIMGFSDRGMVGLCSNEQSIPEKSYLNAKNV